MKRTSHQATSNERGTGARRTRKAAFVLLWIAIWAVVALCVGQQLILASPASVATSFASCLVTADFWLAIWTTLWHVLIGAILACMLGSMLAISAHRFPLFGEFLEPAIQFAKSAPIVCFIVLLLVWFGSSYIDLVAVIIAVFPLYYYAVEQALLQRDRNLAYMLDVFGVSRLTRWVFLEWPCLRPFVIQTTEIAVGMAWKSGVTAELVGLTLNSVGACIYDSKLTLDTPQLLMWTIVIVSLGFALEKLILRLVDFVSIRSQDAVLNHLGADEGEGLAGPLPGDGFMVLQGEEASRALRQGEGAQPLRRDEDVARAIIAATPSDAAQILVKLSQVSIANGSAELFSRLNLTIVKGQRIALTYPMGWGKTTLLRVLLGLQKPEAGQVDVTCRMSAVFQETRLIPQLTAVQNVVLATGCSSRKAKAMLGRLLPPESMDVLPDELSGGMKRCTELCRALAAESECVILDEPFAGLDEQTKRLAIDFVLDYLKDRALVLATHDVHDVRALGCGLCEISRSEGLGK